jgi:hypothetical protein
MTDAGGRAIKGMMNRTDKTMKFLMTQVIVDNNVS